MMKFKTNIKIICAVLLLNFSHSLKASDQGKNLNQSGNSVSTEKIMVLKSSWSGSQNAASLAWLDFNRKIANAYLGFKNEQGDYHLFQEPEELNRYGFYTNGYVKQGKWKFYGNFSYLNEISRKIKWVDILEPFEGNPYSVGDSVGGGYSRDFFIMEGKSALSLNKQLTVGFDVKYKSGVGTKRKDPRPENTITDFGISHGIIWDFSHFKLGGNLRYETAKEDIEFTSVTDRKFDLFYFRGLGAFSSTMEEEGRFSSSDLFGGGLQFNIAGKSLNNLSSLNFSRKTTDIKRGDTYPLQVVLLEDFLTEVSSAFLFSPEGTTVNRLEIFYHNKKTYGEEPVVEPKLEEISYQWSTAAKYTLYWHSANEFGFNYAYYKTIDQDNFNWGCTFSGKINSDKTTYYFVPEFNRQKINQLSLNAVFEKGYRMNRNQVVLAFNGGLRKNIGSELEIVKNEELSGNVNSEFVNHDYNYAISQLWETGISISGGRDISIYKSLLQLFFETGYKVRISGINDNSNRNLFYLNIGINF